MNTSKALKLLQILLLVSLALILMHTILKYVSIVGYAEKHGAFYEISNRFDMNDEVSVPQWFSQTLFLAISIGAAFAAYMTKKGSARTVWLVMSVASLVLSVDDGSSIHEFVLQALHNIFYLDSAPTVFKNTWFFLLPVVLIGLIWFFVLALSSLPVRTIKIMALGCFVFIVGAVFMDSLVNAYPPRSFMGMGLLSAIEGGLQLFGLSTILFALADYLEVNHGQAISKSLNVLRQNR